MPSDEYSGKSFLSRQCFDVGYFHPALQYLSNENSFQLEKIIRTLLKLFSISGVALAGFQKSDPGF